MSMALPEHRRSPQITTDHRTLTRALTLTPNPNPNPNLNPNLNRSSAEIAVFRQIDEHRHDQMITH